jgi:hypothetical protein
MPDRTCCRTCGRRIPGSWLHCRNCRRAVAAKAAAARAEREVEPTAEQVEETVREQRLCLPWWWDLETGRDD